MILMYGTQKEECENARRFENGGHFQRGGCGFWGAPENVTDREIVV